MRTTSHLQSVALEHIAHGIERECRGKNGTGCQGYEGCICEGTSVIYPYATLGDWLRVHNGSEWPSLFHGFCVDGEGYEEMMAGRDWFVCYHGYSGYPLENYVHALTLDEAFELLGEFGVDCSLEHVGGRWVCVAVGIITRKSADSPWELLDQVLKAQAGETRLKEKP